jgi:hypothetical protein
VGRVVKQVPALRLIADYSHWTCVLEAYVGDPELARVIQEMIPNIAHIHARIGYENGPQVCCLPIPSTPTYAHIMSVLAMRTDPSCLAYPYHQPHIQEMIPKMQHIHARFGHENRSQVC